MNMPTLFISHGAPTLALDPIPTHQFLVKLGQELPRPQAILCISAHWGSNITQVSGAPHPSTIYDFGGFPDELYHLRYPAPGAPTLAHRVADMLIAINISVRIDPYRGLDHGAWVPLSLMYPKADIPVVQLSVKLNRDARFHLEMGRILQPLRQEGVLIVGSGGAVHNLSEFGKYPVDAPALDYALAFDAWLEKAVTSGDEEALTGFEHSAPDAARAHPSQEHFLPLFVALGAAGPGAKGRKIHSGFTYGVLSMAAYRWDG
jgi:4,5-DOPA dioxygenase extradiol